MKSKLVGTEVRLVYPVRAIPAEGSILDVPEKDTLRITEVVNDFTGLLAAEWQGKRVLVFEQDLKAALDGTATDQLPPDS